MSVFGVFGEGWRGMLSLEVLVTQILFYRIDKYGIIHTTANFVYGLYKIEEL